MSEIRIDLYSDTATRPTPQMRAFMCEAPVGDEQKGEDPTVNRLQEMVAELLGMEAAVLLPSGTMCNQIALAAQCLPGDLVLLDRTAHPLTSEAGGAAVLAGVTTYPIDGDRGRFTAAQLAEVVEPQTRHRPPFRMVSIEQTTNKPGGCIWPLEQMHEVARAAHERDLRVHMDGARLLNAVAATGIPAAAYAEPFDTAWIDLSKGLGAPVGGVLAGSADFVREAWQWKQRIGGAMRQSGIIAAAGVYALEHHVERLAEDHENARRLARSIAGAPGIDVDPDGIETNMVFFDVAELGIDAATFDERLVAASGVRVSTPGRTRCRAVTHLDVDAADIEEAGAAIVALAGVLAGD